jgi:hypothetical protein
MPPQGPTFVGTGSGAPEVPELPSAQGYNWATWPTGIQILGTGPPGWGLGVRPATLPWKTPLAMKSQTRVTLLRKPKFRKGCSANGGRRIRRN